MKKLNERQIALDIILGIKAGQPAHIALQNMDENLDKQSRSFITQLVYGTLENFLYIDYIISEFTGRPVSKLKPLIAGVLEISVYQIIFMDSVPDHAVVNEAVKLTLNSPQRGLKGFVNGVLRNITRNKDKLPFPEGDEKRALSLKYSIPEFIIDIISDTLHYDEIISSPPDEQFAAMKDLRQERAYLADHQSKIKTNDVLHMTETVLKGLRTRRPLTIRCNTSLITPGDLEKCLSEEGVTVCRNDILPDHTFSISGYDSIDRLKSFKEGLFYVQDTGSILSGEVSGFKPGEKVLDLCAAPGGKSIGAALAGATVDSRDVSTAKTDLIRANVSRMKLKNINVSEGDATVFDPDLEDRYDAVIADVPCSGIGIIGRKPDIAMRLKAEDIDSLTALQQKMIENASRYVKKGGRLIYSTCTVNKAENHENAGYIERPGLKKVFERQWLPGTDGETDGFYTCVFVKKQDSA